ncbi:hypothetical protein RHSIM_Rhsim10G0158100 [Rhododendron simsii]|uniref:Cystatin domain-containing protein n=1 Tax=Rhododendron simsii TaxID=118357 RepID=A0A834GAB4_RHOSS|nr:hypothetical protein RHSIM_Rhsim10G0158100 [Rhododendron simsii]
MVPTQLFPATNPSQLPRKLESVGCFEIATQSQKRTDYLHESWSMGSGATAVGSLVEELEDLWFKISAIARMLDLKISAIDDEGEISLWREHDKLIEKEERMKTTVILEEIANAAKIRELPIAPVPQLPMPKADEHSEDDITKIASLPISVEKSYGIKIGYGGISRPSGVRDGSSSRGGGCCSLKIYAFARTGRDMAHAAQKSLLKGLGQKTLVPHNSDGSTSDVDKQQPLPPVKEDRAMKKQKEEDGNDGFGCGDALDNILDIPVTPLSLDDPDTMKDLQMYSIFALKKCTKLKKKKYQFVKVLKANVRLRRGFLYYITFQAEDIAGSGSPPLNFRAIVHSLKGRKTVEFCEPEL